MITSSYPNGVLVCLCFICLYHAWSSSLSSFLHFIFVLYRTKRFIEYWKAVEDSTFYMNDLLCFGMFNLFIGPTLLFWLPNFKVKSMTVQLLFRNQRQNFRFCYFKNPYTQEKVPSCFIGGNFNVSLFGLRQAIFYDIV